MEQMNAKGVGNGKSKILSQTAINKAKWISMKLDLIRWSLRNINFPLYMKILREVSFEYRIDRDGTLVMFFRKLLHQKSYL